MPLICGRKSSVNFREDVSKTKFETYLGAYF